MNSCHRRRIRPALAAALALFAFAGTVRADEIIDGNNPPTVRNNMHSCPAGYIMTGIDVAANRLLCTGQFVGDLIGILIANESTNPGTAANQWPPDTVTRVAHNYTGPTMHWCGPNRFMTGVHVANNTYNCAELASGASRFYSNRLGHLLVDTGTTLNGVRACPRGTVMVGAHFTNNALLCAELPICKDTSQCSGSGDVCERNCPECNEVFPNFGVCRRRGILSFMEDPSCGGDADGWVTDRSGTVVNFDDTDSFDDNDSESLSLSNVAAGTIIRVYADEDGEHDDDWSQILVKAPANACRNGFEVNVNNSAFRVDYHPISGLNDETSRVEVTSALIDFAGRCLDVNMNNNSAQVFDCHAGPNQSWVRELSGEIRGDNGLCLEANSSEIHTWPNLPAGQTRRASVRVAPCNGSVHQKWSVTDAGQIRMFSNMCLDIVGGTSNNGVAVQLYPCTGNQNQRWLSSF